MGRFDVDESYWKSSTEFFYESLEQEWRSENENPDFGYPDDVYQNENLLLNLYSQNKYDWNEYVSLPRFVNARLADLRAGFIPPVVDWISEMQSSHPNLVFIGENGVGKTHSGVAACRFMSLHGVMTKRGLYMPKVRMLECADAHNILDGWSKTQNADSAVDLYKNVDLLLLDDLGAISTSAKAAVANIVAVIAHRYNMNLPTVATSNVKPDKLIEMYGSTTVRRVITESSVVFQS